MRINKQTGDVLPYAQSMDHPLDKPLNDMYDGKCFFMNLGPTGIRAVIEPDAPKTFKVKYVFNDDKSPARGLISIGDYIIGANRKDFKDPHGFHRQRNGRGWVGPPYELALAIEDSQGKDGKLDLTVLQGGDRSKRRNVSVQLKPVGRFSPTYPWNCPRSDNLLKDLCDFMFEDGLKPGRPDNMQTLLALWASGDKRAIPRVKSAANYLAKRPANPMSGTMDTWMWGYNGIFLGEYYNAFKDESVLPAVEALIDCYETGQDYNSGGYMHRPFPSIAKRVAGGGGWGYGSMAAPGGLAMLAQSIFKAAGLPYSEKAYQRTHQAFLRTAGDHPSGAIAYGFKGWESVNIRVENPAISASKRGIGFASPVMLKDVGPYTLEIRTKPSWLTKEAADIHVYDLGKNRRRAVRNMIIPEPSSPYNTDSNGGGHNAPVGMGALAHFIGNKDNTSWNYLGTHMATCCAKSPKTLWDGHASAIMHAFFGVLGASRASEKDFREFLDYSKTWIILSETHDGKGLVEQPFGAQRNATCSIRRNRQSYTHIAILLLSIPKHKLLITGADYAQPAGPTTAPAPSLRKARSLSQERRDSLDGALKTTLAKLSDQGALKAVPLRLSVTSRIVYLTKVESDGKLTLQLTQGDKTASINWKDLSSSDLATLSLLIAALKPESNDIQAMAGVYMESLGNVKEADALFEKASDASRAKLEKLFD